MPVDLASLPALARQLHDLRRARGWSQPELAGHVGISAAMIGRYERGEMMPPADALAKLAQAFGVTMDHLFHAGGAPQILQDKAMLDRWTGLNELSPAERERILGVLDALVRDAKTRKNYGGEQGQT